MSRSDSSRRKTPDFVDDLITVRAVVTTTYLGHRDDAAVAALDRIAQRLHNASAALEWVANHYPKAVREMPSGLYEGLRRG